MFFVSLFSYCRFHEFSNHRYHDFFFVHNFSRFGLSARSRAKRDVPSGLSKDSKMVCPTRTHFIHPRVAFSVKGKTNNLRKIKKIN